jgi:sulfur relay (sulfurtransferase) complex TusBCD TusD component (DsrE family)
MGKGDPELQQKLIKTYLQLLEKSDTLPAAICFYTDGVRLVVEGSPVIEQLEALEAKGVHLILCSTCLNHYGLAEKVQVGVVGGMTDIIEAQWRADKVITI